jgi:16S rRNA (cytosine967-C5)-methyltransferase
MKETTSMDHRSVALAVLDTVRSSGTLATAAMRKELERRHIEPRTGAGANRLALGVLRERTFLDWCLQQSVDRGLPYKDPRLMDILRIGAYELLFMEGTPGYATLDSVVELAKKTKGKRISGFVNAVLRRTLKAIPQLREARPGLPVDVRLSLPQWLLGEARKAFGDGFEHELAALHQPAPIALRVHTGRTTTADLKSELEKAGLHPAEVDALPGALVLAPEEPPYRTLPFAQGLFWPQDLASQVVASLATAREARRILDACAGLGTKTLQLALDRKAEQVVVCADLSSRRIQSLQRRLEEVELSGFDCLVEDMTAPPDGLGEFDLVLLDAPCSGVGTIRRHPELKWRRTKKDNKNSVRLQRALLESTAKLVSPGGALLYAVCSFGYDEGPGTVARFLENHTDFTDDRSRLPELLADSADPRGPGLLIRPTLLDSDCFYVARLQR